MRLCLHSWLDAMKYVFLIYLLIGADRRGGGGGVGGGVDGMAEREQLKVLLFWGVFFLGGGSKKESINTMEFYIHSMQTSPTTPHPHIKPITERNNHCIVLKGVHQTVHICRSRGGGWGRTAPPPPQQKHEIKIRAGNCGGRPNNSPPPPKS